MVKPTRSAGLVAEQDAQTASATHVTVDTTAGGVEVLAADPLRKRAIISVPTGGQTVFIGTGTVSTADGFGIEAGKSIEVRTSAQIKGIVGATTQVVHLYVENF